MLKNYLMVATRNILRHKLYSAISAARKFFASGGAYMGCCAWYYELSGISSCNDKSRGGVEA